MCTDLNPYLKTIQKYHTVDVTSSRVMKILKQLLTQHQKDKKLLEITI